MQYPAQSNIWRVEQVMKAKPITDGEHHSSRVLGRFRQVFPLTLFPDELIIEDLRVVWVKNRGPWMSEIVSIMATDIACVYASRGLLFGQIHIQNLAGGPEIFVRVLKHKDVYRIRSLVEGIALTSREGLKIKYDNLQTERENLLRAGSIQTNLI